jgi:hypothetical protein
MNRTFIGEQEYWRRTEKRKGKMEKGKQAAGTADERRKRYARQRLKTLTQSTRRRAEDTENEGREARIRDYGYRRA